MYKYSDGIAIKIYKNKLRITNIKELLKQLFTENSLKYIESITIKVTNTYYLILVPSRSLHKFYNKINVEYIDQILPIKEFAEHIRSNIMYCRKILIKTHIPALIEHDVLKELLDKYREYINYIHIRNTGRGIDFRIIFKLDRDLINLSELLDLLVKIAIWGIGEKKYLGFGSTDVVCLDSSTG